MLSIGVVARQTGLEVSTLRKWEARYGFPRPRRCESGQRAYSSDDVETLQLIVRRVARGERVGQIMRELPAENSQPGSKTIPCRPTVEQSYVIDSALAAIRRADPCSLKQLLEKQRLGRTLRDYVENFIAPLTHAVGESWATGLLPIHAEHLYSSLVERLLIRETESAGPPGAPHVLLITPAGEKHTLGLAMIHAILAEAGVPCLRLFSDMPVSEIAPFCRAHSFRFVGLSASIHYPPKILRAQILELQMALAPDIELWVGGSGINRISRLPDATRPFKSFDDLISAYSIALNAEQKIHNVNLPKP